MSAASSKGDAGASARAAVLAERGGRWSIEALQVADPGPGEVRVRMIASGICQTDIHARDGFFPDVALPAVFGHEGAGIVDSLGPGVSSLAPGDRVIMANPSCGACTDCLAGRESYCERSRALKQSGRRVDGSVAFERDGQPVSGSFFQQSSFAGLTLATERNTIKVPADLPLDVLAAFPCGVNTGAGAVMNVLRPAPGEAFVVFGVGTVGMAGLMAARIAGCDPIIAVDLHPARLALARELGATDTVVGGGERVVEEVRVLAGGRGARHSLEAAGFPASLRAAVEVLAPGGVACLTGSAAQGVDVALPMKLIQQGRSVRGCVQGDARVQAFLPQLIELYRAGKMPVDRLITRYPLARINEAVADMLSGRTVKAVVQF